MRANMAYRAAEALGLAVLLACCLLLAVPAAAHAALSSCYSGGDTSWYDDSKTTFTLDSANELAGLAQLVTLEGKTFRGKTVKIGRDMDLSSVTGGKSWLPIGHSAHGSALFQGTFDGQGHILKNLRVDCDMYEVALFGGTRDATIRNFTLTGTVKGTVDVAGVVAVCSNTNLEDIVCDVDVTAEDDYNGRAGGVVGYAMTTQDSHNTYRNLVNKGTVSGHGAKVGGVFGFLGTTGSATVVQCANTGNVTSQVTFGKSNQTDASYGVGGVIGSTTGEYGSFTIAECFNSGKVSSNYMQSIGGIAGYLGGMSTSLTSCYNDGQVSGSKNAGGIAGYFGSQGGTLSATYNKGKVSGSQVGGTLGNASNAGQTLAHNFSHDVLSGDAARAYGDSVQASNAGTSLSTDQIRSQNLLDLLNGYGDFFDWDDPTKTDDPANDGYLYLKWQNLQKGRPNGNPGGNEDGSGESDGDGDKPGDGDGDGDKPGDGAGDGDGDGDGEDGDDSEDGGHPGDIGDPDYIDDSGGSNGKDQTGSGSGIKNEDVDDYLPKDKDPAKKDEKVDLKKSDLKKVATKDHKATKKKKKGKPDKKTPAPQKSQAGKKKADKPSPQMVQVARAVRNQASSPAAQLGGTPGILLAALALLCVAGGIAWEVRRFRSLRPAAHTATESSPNHKMEV